MSLNTFILEGTKSPKTAASRTKNQGGSNRTILNRFNTSSPTRSSSPAKRSRSEMEVSNEGEGGETTTEDTGIASSIASESPQNHDDTEQRPASKKISRNSRDISVDMLAEETIPKLNQNIYQTPQSDSSTSSSGPSSNAAGNAPIVIGGQGPTPSLEEQIAIVTKAVRETLVDGAKGYVISNKWLTEAQERGTNTNKSGKEVKNHVQPPLDNRDLIDTSLGDLVDADGERFVPLKVGLVIDRDIQILPESAWKQIVQWHGVLEDSPDIIRWCHNTSEGDIKNLQYELNPPIFTLVKLAWFPDVTTKDAMAQKNLPPIRIVASRHERVQIFVKRAKSVARVENSAIRLWTTAENVITSLKNAGMPTPAQSRSASPAPGSLHAINIGNKLVLDLKTFTELPDGAAQLADIKDETNNANYNGRSNLDTFGLARPGVLIIEEQIGGPAGGEWISEASKTTLAQLGISKISASTLKPNSSGRSSPAPGGIMTRGRAKRSGRSRGVVGLSNLGNTCYMNAALQCVRAIKELTYYFVEDKYKVEINSSNPLGYGGDIAKVYASLLKEIYAQGTTSVSPRQFKSNVSKNAPTFSGYSQQDSQEFLGWLLDALQEDLNRIQKKPYVEKPDSTDEMVDDPNKLREFADHCWNIYKARNDSVITDLFAGMYKSTLHCPACDKVSIIFDPWSNLTLQLPLASAFHHNVHFFPVTGRPISVEIDIPQNTTFFGFKEYIAKKFNSDPKRLVAAESFSGKIWKLFDDRTPIAEDKPTPSDYVAFYELEHVPTNYPSKTIGQRSMLDIGSDQEDLPPEENIDECIAIPVFQRKPKGSRGLREPIGCPFVISLTRRDLVDEDEIMRAVLTKLNTLTTKDFLSDDEESPEGDEYTMVISASDVDSGSDSKIKAASLQSEEDFVDINSFPDKPVQNGLRTSYPARDMEKRSKTHPKVLERKEFIDNSLRNLFSIEIFSEGTASYPKCWQALNDDSRKYAQLADRIYNRDQGSTKITTSNKQQLALALANNGTPDGSEDELTTDEITPARSDSIEEEEGVEQDSRVNVIASGVGRPNGFKRLNNGPKTYSKKAQRRQTRRNGSIDSFDGAISEPDDVDDAIEVLKPALLRAGEALILEWSLESWKHVYGDNDEFATYGLSERIHPDPEAAERRRLRERKTKDGVTLEECLDELEKEEILSEADAWFCPRCKLHRRASKKFELWAVPDILIIHLKRFTTNGRNKLGLRVDFPLEGLDMSKRVTAKEDGRDLIYDLIAVDNHFGGLGGGHYTALAQNFEDGRWYDFNGKSPKLCRI